MDNRFLGGLLINTPSPAPTDSSDDSIKPANPDYVKKVNEAAVKMEGLFITQMLKEMRKSTEQISPEGSIFKDKIGTDMLDLADTMVADSMASQRAFGIADMVVRQLTLPASVSANPAMPFPLNPRERS